MLKPGSEAEGARLSLVQGAEVSWHWALRPEQEQAEVTRRGQADTGRGRSQHYYYQPLILPPSSYFGFNSLRSITTLDFIPLSSTDCCTRRIFSYSDYNGIQIIMGFLRPNHSNQMCDFSAIWRAESMESSTTFFAAFLASYLAVTIFILNKH